MPRSTPEFIDYIFDIDDWIFSNELDFDDAIDSMDDFLFGEEDFIDEDFEVYLQ